MLAGSYCSAVLTHTHVADRGAAVLRPPRNARSNREATVVQVAISADGLAESGMTVVPYVDVHETHTDVLVLAYL